MDIRFPLVSLRVIFHIAQSERHVDHQERQYRGQTFTRNDVYAASRLPHSKAGADSALFSPMALRHADKAKEWVKDPDGRYGDDFNRLRVAKFKAYLEEQNEKAKYRQHRGKQSSSKGKRPVSKSDDSSGEEGNGHKHKKSKGKGRKVDTDSDEESEPKGKKGKGKKAINYMDSDHMDHSD